MKSLTFALGFLALVSQCFSIDDGLQPVAASSKSVRSVHFDFTNTEKPLDMTPAELKIYAGHVINLVKSKCPAVNSSVLTNVQKYISKRIVHLNPKKPDTNEGFKTLIDTIQQCINTGAPKGLSGGAVKNRHSRVFGSTLYDDFFGEGQGKAMGDDKDAEKIAPSSSSDDVIADNETETHIHIVVIPAEPRQLGVIDVDKIEGELDKPKSSGNAKTTEAGSPNDQSPISDWFSDIWSTVTSFIDQTLFGIGFSRPHSIQPISTSSAVTTPRKATQSGNQLFTWFFDKACEVYCSCEGDVTPDFKDAAKELLEFLFTDAKSMDLASKYFLSTDFKKEIADCVDAMRKPHQHY